MTTPINVTPSETLATKSPSRRAMLAGALGGLGALAAAAIGKASPVRAADGETVLVGGDYASTSETRITNLTNGATVLWGESSSGGTGVFGNSNSSHGVHGASASGHGIHGDSTVGWAGYFDGRVLVKKYVQLVEIKNPAAPASNHLRLFARDNGSGRTQLCVRFHNGVIRVLATA